MNKLDQQPNQQNSLLCSYQTIPHEERGVGDFNRKNLTILGEKKNKTKGNFHSLRYFLTKT